MPVPKPKREIIQLRDFLSLVPTVLVPDPLEDKKKVTRDTELVFRDILNLKIQKDEIEARDKPLRAPILAALEELGFDGVEVPFSSEYAYTIAIMDKENKTIIKEALLAKGIDPAVIEECTRTTPSRYLEARAKKLR